MYLPVLCTCIDHSWFNYFTFGKQRYRRELDRYLYTCTSYWHLAHAVSQGFHVASPNVYQHSINRLATISLSIFETGI